MVPLTPVPKVKDAKKRESDEDVSQSFLFPEASPALPLHKVAGTSEYGSQIIKDLLGHLAKEGYPATNLGDELRSMALSVNGIESAVHFACKAVRAMQDTKITHTVDIRKVNLHEMTAEAISGGLRASLIGDHLRQLAASKAAAEIVAAYSGIIAKALIVRRDRQNGNWVRPTQFTKEGQ
jgi:hypothetical protein